MPPRDEILRRRIALYQRYMRECVSPAEVAMYLRQIRKHEAELATIAETERQQECPE